MSGLRVTGGRLGGRRFLAPRGDVRPTSDRVRESLFARLGDLSGHRVLDLYSGSGSLAIEAVSRGASSVVCVERAAATLAALRANLASLDLDPMVRVIPGDAVAVVRRLGRGEDRFDLVLLDPPYASDQAGRVLKEVVAGGILNEGATVVLERGRRHPPPQTEGLIELDERRYGDTVISRYIRSPNRSPSPEPESEPKVGKVDAVRET